MNRTQFAFQYCKYIANEIFLREGERDNEELNS